MIADTPTLNDMSCRADNLAAINIISMNGMQTTVKDEKAADAGKGRLSLWTTPGLAAFFVYEVVDGEPQPRYLTCIQGFMSVTAVYATDKPAEQKPVIHLAADIPPIRG